MRVDVVGGMASAVVVASAIMISTAFTLHTHGLTTIATADQAASALEPLAGSFAQLIFTLGIVGLGLLAVPVLAGSTGYAIAEAIGRPEGLSRHFREARGFYLVIAGSMVIGVGLDLLGTQPHPQPLLRGDPQRHHRAAADHRHVAPGPKTRGSGRPAQRRVLVGAPPRHGRRERGPSDCVPSLVMSEALRRTENGLPAGMNFEIVQDISATVDAVDTALVDPDFLVRMAELPKLGSAEVVDQRRDGDVVYQDVRYLFQAELSRAVTRVVDPKLMTWIERSVCDLATHETQCEIRPDHYGGLLPAVINRSSSASISARDARSPARSR